MTTPGKASPRAGIGRVPVLDVEPTVLDGRFSARVVVGETFGVSATVWREGHDLVGATAVLTPPGGSAGTVRRVRLRPLPNGQGARGTDGFTGTATGDAQGLWRLAVEGWADRYGTWVHDVEAKLDAGQQADELANDLETGALVLERAVPGVPREDRALLAAALTRLRDAALPLGERVAAALHEPVAGLLWRFPVRDLVTSSVPVPLVVDRVRAMVGSWYELFPRSYGGFTGAAADLDRVAEMGFDVVYLPPVHPVGRSFRKGPNNTLDAGPDDVGSPWAIGAAEGGHDAVHPDLGSWADFDAFVARAGELGMEVALDFALQCSPDHPWVTEHPEFFTHRPDGSIAYAENPPKKYQDIYPLDFDSGGQPLRDEVLRVLRVWMDRGIRIFRVDNPHTKPVDFWEWLIGAVKATDPDVLFLAEAFTRPPMVHGLAMVGFTQSYTYFTWRTARWELEEYLLELSNGPGAAYLRPNLFVNTPDILHASLQEGGVPMFKIRAVLAACASPTWGVYSGYELAERTPLRPGSEEYLDTEKFQLRPRDYGGAGPWGTGLAPYLTTLNRVRREHLALQRLRGLVFHAPDNPQVLAFSRRVWHADGTPDTMLTVVNLDPHAAQETTLFLDTAALGAAPGEELQVHDQLGARATYQWGTSAYVRLDPGEPAHLFHVTHADGRPA